jgi:hypothetical protein
MEVINNINDLQEALRLHWDELTDDHFRVIICKALRCGVVFYRRNNIDDEIAYMNAWIKQDNKFGYGGDITPIGEFEIKTICDGDTDYKRNLLFTN